MNTGVHAIRRHDPTTGPVVGPGWPLVREVIPAYVVEHLDKRYLASPLATA
jgi:hypothetical protein